jgi:hypothetical protein
MKASFLWRGHMPYSKIEDQESSDGVGSRKSNEQDVAFENLRQSSLSNSAGSGFMTRRDVLLAVILVAWAITGITALSLWQQTISMEKETPPAASWVPNCKYRCTSHYQRPSLIH